MIRVGKCKIGKYGKHTYPDYKDYTNIVVLAKSSEYGCIGPYSLKNDKGQLMENIWQFSKIYEVKKECNSF
jgi:hypothetical protein